MRINWDRPRYLWYLSRQKLRQLPDVIGDITPSFERDEICRPAQGDVYAIVVKYVKFGLGPDFLALLDSLAAASVNAIVVCNGTPTEAMLGQMRARAQRILVRRNVGRDMGAYRAATLYLSDGGLDPARIIYLNDSVIYIPGADLDRFVQRLVNTSCDVVGAAENHEFQHHLGSYALSFSGRVFNDRKVLAFWRKYRPYDIRPHAIRNGELKLNTLLGREGFTRDVIYSADALWERLQAMSFAELVDQLRYMSGPFLTADMEPALRATATLAATFAPPPSDPVRQAIGRQPPTLPRRLLDGAVAAPEDRLIKATLIDRIMRPVTQGSQIHYGFGLFHRLLGCPLVKKDLFQRRIFLEQQMMDILDDVPNAVRTEILRELLNRGRRTHLSKRDRFLERNGLI